MAEFKFGDEVRDRMRNMRGMVTGGQLMSMTSTLYHVIDESRRRWSATDEHLVKLAPAGRPGIGAVVAMVAANQLCWIVWARGVPSEIEGCEDMDWEEEAELGSRPEAMSTMAAMAATNEERCAKHEWLPRLEWKVLPEGVQP